MILAFICSPFRNENPTKQFMNTVNAKKYSKQVLKMGYVPVAPHLLFPQFIDEQTQRELAMECCLAILQKCDIVFVFGEPTKGMVEEIKEAQRLGIEINCDNLIFTEIGDAIMFPALDK